jgi:hypothetical protein
MVPEHKSYKVKTAKWLGVSLFFQEKECSDWSFKNYFIYARASDPKIKYKPAARLFKLYLGRIIKCDIVPDEIKCHLGQLVKKKKKKKKKQYILVFY